MSEIDDKNNENIKQFDHMSTEELEMLLKTYTQSSEDADMDFILSILKVIEKREILNPSGKYTDVDTAWASFQKNYRPASNESISLYDFTDNPKDKSSIQSDNKNLKTVNSNRYRRRPLKHKALLRTAAVIITIIVISFSSTIVAKAFGYNLWGAVAKWTRETFGFSADASPSLAQDNTNNPSGQYSNLEEALVDYGISEALAPSWIPDDFVLTQTNVFDSPKKTVFNALYNNDSSVIIINIARINFGTNGTYEKDDQNITVYEKNDIAHYIMSNNEQKLAVWVYKDYECSISGNISELDIKKMIDSIYER